MIFNKGYVFRVEFFIRTSAHIKQTKIKIYLHYRRASLPTNINNMSKVKKNSFQKTFLFS